MSSSRARPEPMDDTLLTEPVSVRVANIERAMDLLEALARHPSGKAVGELSVQLNIPKSAVSRILGTLEAKGYVARDPYSGRFRIALKLLALAYRHADSLGVEDISTPLLRGVADETGELVQLALVDGEEMRYVVKAEGVNRVRTVSLIGTKVIVHATAAGKVWLASLAWPQALKLALNDGLVALTPQTIIVVDGLSRELDGVRRNGYALNICEHTPEVNSIAVPVKSRRMKDTVVGAVILTGPEFRLSKKRLVEFAPRLREVAEEIGEALPGNLIRVTKTSFY
ncbi:MAG: IclR family transcriptional regulator [Acidimicrobiia bacterium]|nr:IclR family transcriptional regulator [Acidimicrobiia bacterium]